MRIMASRRRAIRDGLSVAGVVVLIWFFVIVGPSGRGYDAFAYWDVRLDDLYGRSFGQLTEFGAFRYSPPIAFFFAPFHALPFEAFYWMFTALQVAALVWMARELTLAVCAFVAVPMTLYQGNVDILIALLIVVGMRKSQAWAIPTLLKLTPIIGLTWFAVRREWRSLAIGLAVLIVIAGLSAIVRPDLWSGYLRVLADNAGADPHGVPIPLVVRIPAALLIVALAARTDRPWLVAVAITLCQPSLSIRSSSILVAAVPLWRASHPTSSAARSAEVHP